MTAEGTPIPLSYLPNDEHLGLPLGDPNFGRGDESERFFDALLKLPVLTREEVKDVLTELYETIYGIYDHINSDDPLALYIYREEHQLNHNDPMYDRIEEFVNERVYELTGVTLTEFLSSPPQVIKYILKVVNERNKREQTKLDELQNKINTTTNQ